MTIRDNVDSKDAGSAAELFAQIVPNGAILLLGESPWHLNGLFERTILAGLLSFSAPGLERAPETHA